MLPGLAPSTSSPHQGPSHRNLHGTNSVLLRATPVLWQGNEGSMRSFSTFLSVFLWPTGTRGEFRVVPPGFGLWRVGRQCAGHLDLLAARCLCPEFRSLWHAEQACLHFLHLPRRCPTICLHSVAYHLIQHVRVNVEQVRSLCKCDFRTAATVGPFVPQAPRMSLPGARFRSSEPSCHSLPQFLNC